MAKLKDLSLGVTDLLNIPLDALDIDPGFNVRLDTPELADHIATIAESIKASGFLRTRPLTVRLSADQTKAVVVDGHCRLAAARLAAASGVEIKSLPCIPEGRGVSVEDRTLMLLTANSGLVLSPLEQATVIKRLLSFGWSESEIGRRIGKTRQHVANLLDLAGAPPQVRELVANGTVSATEAVKTVRREGGPGAVEVLTTAAETARAEGRTKVTGKHIQPKAPPAPKPNGAYPPARPAVTVARPAAPAPIITARPVDTESAIGAANVVVNMWKGMQESDPELARTLPAPFIAAMIRLRESL
jgi:ParB-like chromosome segregation protein Spo0J